MRSKFNVQGKMSVFGGPHDTGVSPSEGLSLFNSEAEMISHGLGDFLLPADPGGATGLARRLNPDAHYLACRWWETDLEKRFLKDAEAWVTNVKTGARAKARPVDSGPADWTNRVADLSPGLAAELGLSTNDICTVEIGRSTEFEVDTSPNTAAPRIYRCDEWGARDPLASYFAKAAARGIVVHNTEGKNRDPFGDPEVEVRAAFANARQIQQSHMDERHWHDTGQHFTISQGGVITEGRHGTLAAAKQGLVVRGAHSPHANDDHWGIELAGDNRKQFVVSSEQWSALIALGRWLRSQAGIDFEIQPHNHFKDTTCPGRIVDHLDELRTAILK